MSDLISVIIPIYKVEKYIVRCVESIVNQTYTNLEIILVDDGSPDNCPQICDDYAEKDNRIKVVHKENGGLSDARNAGMKVATGDYISFIDSDDYVSLEMYQDMINAAINNKADIVECNVNYDYNGRIEKYNDDKYAVYNDNYSVMEAYIKHYHIKTVVWNKLYERKLLNDIEFEFGKYNEDEFFTYKVLAKVSSYVHLDKYYYYYFQRSDSIMGSSFSLKQLDSVEGCMKRAEFIRQNYGDLYFYVLKNLTFQCIGNYQKLICDGINDVNAKKILKKYRKQLCWNKCYLSNLKLKDKFYVVLSSISLSLCARVRIILKKGV